MSSPLDVDGPFGRFAAGLLALELPELPEERLRDAVRFVCRRADQTPGPLRLGVVTLAVGTGVAERLLDADRVLHLMRSTRLPFVGELARMVRSLGFAYIWETWPATGPTGRPGVGAER